MSIVFGLLTGGAAFFGAALWLLRRSEKADAAREKIINDWHERMQAEKRDSFRPCAILVTFPRHECTIVHCPTRLDMLAVQEFQRKADRTNAPGGRA